MRMARRSFGASTTIVALLDGEFLADVIEAALDNNMMVEDLKKVLIKEHPKHKVTFEIWARGDVVK